MTNDEGGTNNEEFRIAAVIDRVNTTWTALMGTTFRVRTMPRPSV
jgi:muramidase (phage lysozyme)